MFLGLARAEGNNQADFWVHIKQQNTIKMHHQHTPN
ncbi:rCG61556 [Rattus norvegicus]|uniref:RCG61556 n=1 Tax=Rattus norvegicus TaxID=10116 RepID=A6H9A3_RAT|nr:rCG61556 [Rattus norvegicus]